MKQLIIGIILAVLIAEAQCAKGFTKSEAWTYGTLCSIGVSITALIASLFNIFVVKKAPKKMKFWLETIIMFGCGALFGDAYVHIIPEVYTSTECDPRLLSFFVFVGFFSFELLDKVMLFFGISHSHGVSDNSEGSHDHSHSHSHSHSHHKKKKQPEPKSTNQIHNQSDNKTSQVNILNNNDEDIEIEVLQDKKIKNNEEQAGFDNELIRNQATSPDKLLHLEQPDQIKVNEEENIGEKKNSVDTNQQKVERKFQLQSLNSIGQQSSSDLLKKDGQKKKFMASWRNKNGQGWLFLIADFIHQINDGLAIGITFLAKSKITAVSTLIAIAAHELPLDLGVMSLLLESNFTICQGLICNQLKEISKLIGCLIGLGIGSTNESALNYTLGFVIGNFLFIALVEMFGFLNREKKKKFYLSKSIAFICGIGSMYLILLIEEAIEKIGEGEGESTTNSTLINSTLPINSTVRFLTYK